MVLLPLRASHAWALRVEIIGEGVLAAGAGSAAREDRSKAGHFSSAVSPSLEVEVPLPPPLIARRHRYMAMFCVEM